MEENPENINVENSSNEEENIEIELPQLPKWEDLEKNDEVVKKYIVYISKDFVPLMDDMNTDQRSAYINDAIQNRVDLADEQKQKNKKQKLIIHIILAIITICLITPFAVLGVNKAIMVTFENYKYSQDNFEKLYKQRFEKDRAYMRSIQYNKEHEKKLKQ